MAVGPDTEAKLARLLGPDGARVVIDTANFLHNVTAGAVSASKALVCGASSQLDALTITAGTIPTLGSTTATITTANVTTENATTANITTGNVTNLKIGAGTPVAVISNFTFAPASAGANVCEVTITAKDGSGATVAVPFQTDLWLSDAATGAGHTGTSASGTVTVKTASGTIVDIQVAKKAIRVQALATGVFILEITDSGKTGFYVTALVPGTGRPVVSSQLVAGNYG